MYIKIYPDSLSLVGNMNHLLVESTEDVSFSIKVEGLSSDLVERVYSPNSNHLLEINLYDIVFPALSFSLQNVSEPYRQADIVKTFVITLKGVTSRETKTKTFTVVRGGVDRLADTAENFLLQNFLTWQPNIKPVTYYTPEFLTYYAAVASKVKCKARVDGNDVTVTLASIPAGQAWTIPVQYAIIAGKVNGLPSYYDVWVEDAGGQRLTYIQRYFAQDMKSENEQWILFENSLGGIDTFRAYGSTDMEASHSHNVAEIEEMSSEYRVDTERKFKKNTGRLDRKERLWLLDFFPSLAKYLYVGDYLRQIVVTDSDVNYKASELPSQYNFTYRYADAKPYLNIPRTDAPLEILDIDIPEVGSFTVAPRLVEFPRIQLSSGALFPVQDPYSSSWAATTLGAIAQFFIQYIIGSYSGGGGIGHSHSNLDFLENLSWGNILRKDRDDTAAGVITFLKGIVAKAKSYFKGIENDGDISNTGTISTKNIVVTGKATFMSVEIEEVKAAGGMIVESPGRFRIDRVETTNRPRAVFNNVTGKYDGVLRCYQLAKDGRDRMVFNEIRPDLLYLKNQGVLDYDYPLHEYKGATIVGDVNTWQNVCQRLGNAADLRYELPADDYNEHVAKAIEETLKIMDTDASFRPLKNFTVKGSGVKSSDAPFDRIIFLTGGLDSANNKQFNGKDASFNDSLRRPWYNGTKSLYDMEYEVNGQIVEWDSNEEIDNDFDTGFTSYNYLIAFVLCIATTLSLLTILLNLGGRIFNLLVLYVVAPPALASAPLDGGGKTKQWITSFIIQVLSVFGSIIAMRLLLVFVPVIYDPALEFFPTNAILNFVAKAALLLAAFAGSQKAGSLINGILSDTAGMASSQAADFSGTAAKVLGVGSGIAGMFASKVSGAASFAASPLTNQVKKVTGAYRSLGSGPLTKAGRERQAMEQAKQRLAMDQAYETLKGGGAANNSAPANNGASNAKEQAQSDVSAPVSSAPYAPDIAVSGKEGSIEQRATSLAAQRQADNRLADIGGRLAAQKVVAPTGGNVPKAPVMPKEGLKPDPGKEARMSALQSASFRQGSIEDRAGMLANEQAWSARHGRDGEGKTVPIQGGSVPKPPTMRNATGQSLQTQSDPDKARRQAAMKNAKSPQLRRQEYEQQQKRMDDFTANQFLRNRKAFNRDDGSNII